jgi:hypothetical protein
MMWFLLVAAGLLGLFALLCPPGRVVSRSAPFEGSEPDRGWISAGRSVSFVERLFDVDHQILPHSRMLGGMVVASVLFLGWLLAGR